MDGLFSDCLEPEVVRGFCTTRKAIPARGGGPQRRGVHHRDRRGGVGTDIDRSPYMTGAEATTGGRDGGGMPVSAAA